MSSARMTTMFGGRTGACIDSDTAARPTMSQTLAMVVLRVSFENLVDEKQVGQKCADVDVRVEVVDHLRMNRRLREHHLYGGLRVLGVAVDDGDERAVRRGILADAGHELREERAESRDGVVEFLQEVPDL